MECYQVRYYIVDKNSKFVSCDYEAYMLYSSDYILEESYSANQLTLAKEMSFNLEQEYVNGEYGKMNVEFPLRAVKVTSNHVVEEVE